MSHLTTCYGADIEALADIAGDPGAFTATRFAAWNLQQWTMVAETLGFLPLLKAAVEVGSLVGLTPVALQAFEQWIINTPRSLSPSIPPSVRAARARARHEALVSFAAAKPSALWYLDEPAIALAGGAAFEVGGTSLSGRAFYDDTASSVLHAQRTTDDPLPGPWRGRVLLSLGTFPWLYGSRLFATGPALEWEPAGEWNPARTAMELCAGMWQPLTNLQQDARDIVARYRYFQRGCEPFLRAVPAYRASQAIPGRLYRDGQLLRIEQASLSLVTLDTPLGPLNAVGHNYIIRRFAAFFALRRSLVLGIAELPTEWRAAIAVNPDSCLKSQSPKTFPFAISTL